MLFSLLAAIVAGVVKLRDPQLLPIRAVKIEGRLQHLDPRHLEQVATPLVSGGFFSVDLRAAERALVALPWVYRVSLRRRWPDTLLIEIEEQQPVAQWGDEALVNPYGETFRPEPGQFPAGLPVLRGPEGKSRELLMELAAATERLAPLGIAVREMREDRRRAWQLVLDNGITLALGRESRVQRLERFAQIYDTVLAPRATEVVSVDLRYTNGLAVAWRQTPPAGPPNAIGR